jgi:hypothetical protein
MEYLPSGELCTGTVTKVHATGFSASCRLTGGQRRFVDARWHVGNSPEVAGGIITAHA